MKQGESNNEYHKRLRLLKEDYQKGIRLADEIGAMLWGAIKNGK